MRSLPNWKRSLGKFPKLDSRNRPASEMPKIFSGGGTFGSGLGALDIPAIITPPEPDTTRYGWGAIGNDQYDDIAGQVARFAGDPAYAFWFSQASITQTKVTNWRSAFPGSTIIAYLMLFNLEMEPAVGTTYYDLVNDLTDDLWLRLQSDDSKVAWSGPLGYYFWNDDMVNNVLLPWLSRTSGTLTSWLTKYDGFFLDNLNYTSGYQQWAGESALNVKINGSNVVEQDIIDLYDRIPARLVAAIRGILDTGKIIMPNAAAYLDGGGTLPIVWDGTNINGVLWEPVDNQNTIYTVGVEPPCNFQFVDSEPNWTTIQSLTYPDGVGFMQGGSFRTTGRLP